MDGRAEVDVLALMERRKKRIVLGCEEEEISSLGFLEWLSFDAQLVQFVHAMGDGDVLTVVKAMNTMLELATGVSPARVSVGEALVAFPFLVELNEIQFIDPSLFDSLPQRHEDEAVEWENRMVLEFVATLATRFSMDEIREMQPAFALLLWQQIREERSNLLSAIFYSSELGFKQRGSGKSAKLIPRDSPYEPYWLSAKRGRLRRQLLVPEEDEIAESPFVTHPENVVDLRGRRE